MTKEIDQAKAEWEKVSWIDQQDYNSFDEYYKSDAWRESVKYRADAEKTNQELGGGIFGFIGVIVIIYILIKIAGYIFGGVGGYFEDKADRKSYCQTFYKVQNAKTEFAAKKAYEKCMSNK